MNKYDNDQDLNQYLERKIDEYLISKCIYQIPLEIQENEEKKEKEKQNLLDSIIFQFQQLIDTEISAIENRLEEEVYNISKKFEDIKQIVISNSRRESNRFQVFTPRQMGDSSLSIPEQDAYYKKNNDFEEKVNTKMTSFNNILNLLMDNQVTIKAQIGELSKRFADDSSLTIGSNSTQIEESPLEQNVENKFNELKNVLEDLNQQNKLNIQNKLLFYWKALDDISERLLITQKTLDATVQQVQELQKTGGKRGSIFIK